MIAGSLRSGAERQAAKIKHRQSKNYINLGYFVETNSLIDLNHLSGQL